MRLVFACGANREFGNGDSLPWGHCSHDFKTFKSDTLDSVCLMGSKTWESLPMTLTGRVNAVMARNPVYNKKGESPDMRMRGELAAAIYDLRSSYPDKDINIIGGIGMLDEGINYADEIYMSLIIPTSFSFPATHYLPMELYQRMKSEFKMECETNVLFDVSKPILGWSKFKFVK